MASEESPEMRDHVQALEATLDEARTEAKELKERMLRVAADADNTRKRALREKQEFFQYGLEGFARDMLSTVDGLDRAIVNMPEGAERMGVEMVLKRLLMTLAAHNVTMINPLGNAFSPTYHEGISKKFAEGKEPGTVIEVLHRGAMLYDRLLRPALVVVACTKEEQEKSWREP